MVVCNNCDKYELLILDISHNISKLRESNKKLIILNNEMIEQIKELKKSIDKKLNN